MRIFIKRFLKIELKWKYPRIRQVPLKVFLSKFCGERKMKTFSCVNSLGGLVRVNSGSFDYSKDPQGKAYFKDLIELYRNT